MTPERAEFVLQCLRSITGLKYDGNQSVVEIELRVLVPQKAMPSFIRALMDNAEKGPTP